MRSAALLIDPATGEPKHLTPSQMIYPPWKVLVWLKGPNTRKSKKFWSYKEAKETAARLQERFGEAAEVHVVSRQLGYGPPHSKVSDRQLLDANYQGQWWCPYCRKFRRFHYLPAIEMKVCEFCRVRETDWHVHMCNPVLWSSDYLARQLYG